ncbi:MAG: hypothetical protein JJU36_10595 [Phycisphaeraceae bacterium]|nr:hypothetical protein [Phycisphaeraceae bacterium]
MTTQPEHTLTLSIALTMALLIVTFLMSTTLMASEEGGSTWPAPVERFDAPKPGEHPRLLFRKRDVPELRARARTPEGQAIVARLRYLLDGADGDTIPQVFNRNPPVNIGAKGPRQLPELAFTMGHPAGYGMLYQLTGEQKYADLAKEALTLFLEGQSDRDERYTWNRPGAGLRTGMMMVCVAMAYDLAYDGWDEAFRRRVVNEIQNYRHVAVASGGWEGGPSGLSFERIVNPYYPPTSNHYGALVGGAAVAILAIRGDPGADEERLHRLQRDVERNLVRALSEGFGDHGFFSEGPGPSHMAANTALVVGLQAMKVAGGRDYITPRTNAPWLTLRWAFEAIPRGDAGPHYPCRNPGAYGTEYLDRVGTSDGGRFSQGFGAIPDSMKPALLWTYRNLVQPSESAEYPRHLRDQERSFDAFIYPHRAVLSLVNWPIAVEPVNPARLLGHSYHDTVHGYLAFRNRWRDADDIIVTAYLQSGPRGFIRNNDTAVRLWGLGLRAQLPSITGKIDHLERGPDGSSTFTVMDGRGARGMAVDFSGRSGAPVMVVMVGNGLQAPDRLPRSADGANIQASVIELDADRSVLVTTLQRGDAPDIRQEAARIRVGHQTITVEGDRIRLGE